MDARTQELNTLKAYTSGYGIDIGCGHWKLYENSLGTDIHKKGEKCSTEHNYPSVAEVQSDAHYLPFPNETFDYAILSHMLEHVADPTRCLQEAGRIVKKGGFICVIVPLGNHKKPEHIHIFGLQETTQLAYSAQIGDIVQLDTLQNDYTIDLVLQKRKTWAKPKYSIILPVWNQLKYTQCCIAHLEDYTEDYELIVVDNGSVDGAGEYANRHADKYIRNSFNRGCAIAWNQGISLAEGEYVVILNTDVYVFGNWLQDLTECLNQPNVAFAFPSLLREPYTREHIHALREQWKTQNPFTGEATGCLFLCRKETFEKLGKFNEAYGFGMFEDADMWRRAREAGMRLLATRKCWVHHVGNASWAKLYNHNEVYQQNRKLYEGAE